MPLDVSTLKTPILDLFQKGTASAPHAAKVLADAYATYASAGLFGASAPVFTGVEKTLLQSTLLTAMNPVAGLPATLALAWQNGLMAFWLSPPIVVAGVPAGSVTGVLQAAAIGPALTTLFSNPTNNAETSATQLATVLDTATRTVQATVAPPPGTLLFLT